MYKCRWQTASSHCLQAVLDTGHTPASGTTTWTWPQHEATPADKVDVHSCQSQIGSVKPMSIDSQATDVGVAQQDYVDRTACRYTCLLFAIIWKNSNKYVKAKTFINSLFCLILLDAYYQTKTKLNWFLCGDARVDKEVTCGVVLHWSPGRLALSLKTEMAGQKLAHLYRTVTAIWQLSTGNRLSLRISPVEMWPKSFSPMWISIADRQQAAAACRQSLTLGVHLPLVLQEAIALP